MRPDLPTLLPLVCPACHTRDEHGMSFHSLDLERALREGPGGEVLQGVLACRGCRRRYPIIDGIPLVLADLTSFLAGEIHATVERDLEPDVAALLALAGPDEAPYARLLEHLSIYMDAHWGDRAEPPPDGPKGAEPFGMRDVAARLLQPSTGVARAVELGCSVGRGLAELRRHANLVVGIDIHFGALRRARRMLSGAPLDYARRSSGRHYGRATATAGDRAAPDVALLCADALNPPLPPFAWNRVAALNLIDSLRAPTQLLSVMDKLCAPGGELLLASPYAWQSSIVAEEHRPTTADPAAEIARILREGQDLSARYTITDEAELAWWLRRDARSGTAYTIHWLRANKP